MKTEEYWMIIGPNNNLHAALDICKSKGGKIFTHSNDSNRKPNAAAHQMGQGYRDHIGIGGPKAHTGFIRFKGLVVQKSNFSFIIGGDRKNVKLEGGGQMIWCLSFEIFLFYKTTADKNLYFILDSPQWRG